MPSDPLDTYLRDHYAGSAGGVSLIERLADGASGDGEEKDLRKLHEEIAADKEALGRILDGVGLSPSPVKNLGARVGERLARPKLHSHAAEARVLQLEGMIMGVTGKLQLWRTLIGLRKGGDDRFDHAELIRLRERAEGQRSELERIHGDTGGLESG